MSTIAVLSGRYCLAEEIIEDVIARTGFVRISDDDLVRQASKNSAMSEEKIARAIASKKPMLNTFTRERERSIAHLRLAVAERLNEDSVLIDGACSHLIPSTITHVLRVCLVADLESRLQTAATSGAGHHKEAFRLIRESDEEAAAWVAGITGASDPWSADLYDMLIPTDKTKASQAAELIVDFVGKEAVQVTPASKQAVEDFRLAARTGSALATHGHFVEVECSRGNITLIINKHVLMLQRLERELESIATDVEGVKSVTTRVGSDFYKPDIYRDVEFEKPSRVLLVDDEREFVQTLSERLEMRDVGSAVAYDGESALRMVEHDEPDVIILDLRMPGIDGIEVLRRVKKSNPHIEVIILTGHGSAEDRETCMRLGAFAYLQKPVDIEILSDTLKQANEKAHASFRSGTPLGEPSP